MSGLSGDPDPDLTTTTAGPAHTFVVRLSRTSDPGGVRGRIQHVRTRQCTDFSTRQHLESFIQAYLERADRN